MAASTININRVYPPIVDSSIPAFLATAASININFSLPKSLNYEDVKNISIKFVQQSNNKSIINTDKYWDGIIYMEKPATSTDNGIYTVTVNSSDIKLGDTIGWVSNTYYKIQIRFGYGKIDYTDKISFFKWKKSQTVAEAFSEWSNVIITKAIDDPIVEILNNKDTSSLDVGFILISSNNVEDSRFPKFEGGYQSDTEPLDKYRFRLYEGSFNSKNPPSSEPYLQSDWLQYNDGGKDKYSALVSYSFNRQLDQTGTKMYSLIFDVITMNNYQKSSEYYNFTITENYLKQLQTLVFTVKDNTESTILLNKIAGANQVAFQMYKEYFGLKGQAPKFIKGYYDDADGYNAGDIIYQTGNINEDNIETHVLSKITRIKAIEDFSHNLRADENGSLEIYIKNNPYEVKEKITITTIIGEKVEREIDVEKYQSLDGTFILSRACETDNYTQWKDIAQFDWYNETNYDDKLTLLYEDFTVESGVKYKYALQKQNAVGLRSAPKYESDDIDSSPAHWSNFQYSYIYNNGIQVRLDFDCKMNSYKHTTLFQKQDSLNSKYPIILRNGLAHYAEFQLGAKISLLSDIDSSFLMRNDAKGGYYHSWYGDIVISKDKYIKTFERDLQNPYNNDYNIRQYNIQNASTFNTNPTNDNIYMERIYRHWVEEFLNDGGYKLFKSPTEGNHIVTLTNVTWTPQASLYRMIYDFNSTAYEVADCTPENIILYQINPLTTLSNNSKLAIQNASTKTKTVIGQVARTFNGKYAQEITNNKLSIVDNNKFNLTYDNICNAIKLQEEQEISEDRKYRVRRIKAIWVEQYPKLNLKNKIEYLKNKTSSTMIGQLTNAVELLRCEQLLQEYEKNQTNIITMIINGKEISMMPSRIYHLDDAIIDSMYLKFTRPILINYIVDLEEEDFLEMVTVAKREFAQWGQLGGVFTDTQDILDNHQFFRNDDTQIVNEKYNYGLYSTLNLMDIIKEKVHTSILNNYSDEKLESTFDLLYNDINEFLNRVKDDTESIEELLITGTQLLENYRPLSGLTLNKQTDAWMNGSDQLIIYNFTGIDSIEIEADANTDLVFYREYDLDATTGNYHISSPGTHVRIGPTNKLILNPLKDEIVKVEFVRPTYAIVNYKSVSSLEVKKGKQKEKDESQEKTE